MRSAWKGLRILCLLLGAWVGLPGAATVFADTADELSKVEADVRQTYADVQHMSPDELEAQLVAPRPPLVFDSRSEAEFAVSHIDGARHVDPGIWASTFRRRFGDELKGRTVVIYCSVGVRSSRLAARIADLAKDAGAAGVFNLEGGLFRWHNEGRALVGPNGPTDEIHPYDAQWGRYLTRQSLTATEPGQSEAHRVR